MFGSIFRFMFVVRKLIKIFYAFGVNCLKELVSKQLKFEKQYGSNICFAQLESTELNIFEFDRE